MHAGVEPVPKPKGSGSRSRARRTAASLALAGTAALLAALLARAAAAETRDYAFQIAWGNVTLAEARVQMSRLGERYSVHGAGRTEGPLAFFIDWQGESRTEGLAADGRVRPLRHSHRGTWNDEARRTEIDWNVAGTPRVSNVPPPDEAEVTPVSEDSTLDTVDPFTVILMAVRALETKGRCELEAKVWDGRRRYDLTIEHAGRAILEADRPWAYAGPSIECRLSIQRIGGFRREAGRWKAKDDSGERTLWVADLGRGRYAPVRAELETAFGTVVGRLRPEPAAPATKEQAQLQRPAAAR